MLSAVGIQIVLSMAPLFAASVPTAQPLTFERRVAAQEAIERVYYAHQIGAARPFEEAVPRQVLERKVRTYLKQSVALQEFWRTPVTGEMLRAELDRIARHTRFPERLQEIYRALGNDSVLLEECLARSTLVDRLIRSFFAFDGLRHAAPRAAAEALRDRLASGELYIDAVDPHRTVVAITSRANTGAEPHAPAAPTEVVRGDGPRTLELPPEEYSRLRSRAPQEVRAVGGIRESRDEFTITILLAESANSAQIATYAVEKPAWEEWWREVQSGLDESSVRTVAGSDHGLPTEADGRAGFDPLDSAASTFPLPRSWNPEIAAAAACPLDDLWDNGSLDDVPTGRARHSAVWTGSQMIVWGGNSTVGDLNTGGRYDPLTDTWTATSITGAPSGRGWHVAVWTGSEMIVWGGVTPLGAPPNTGGRYDPLSDTWVATSTVGAPTARRGHTAIWTGSEMIVWGGIDATPYANSGGRYDPLTDTWTATSTVGAPTGRDAHSAIWTGSRMIVWGGYRYALPVEERLNTGGLYDPVTDSWTSTSTGGSPSGRELHTAIWTGSKMIVWGGYPSNTTGGRYDPPTDTWAPTSPAGAPSGRNGHTATWTGSEMIVWGGQGAPYRLDTGGRYNPLTDTWTPTSTAGAPAGRVLHTAVWAASRMIVWGGSGLDHDNTGGRYDPLTDTWTPTFVGGAPPGSRHTAVWTGSQMIIWGGSESYFLGWVNTGGRYDPLVDTWTPTSTAGAPSGRHKHTAVWTGSEMIEWGGIDGGSPYGRIVNTGGRYDPLADTWTPTSTDGAPSERYEHAAVWTGSEMIVWGGVLPLGAPPNTGGRYDPLSDTWVATSTVGAPIGRSQHSAVWTGTRIIVWGGIDSDFTRFPRLNTGGLYDPLTDTWTPTSTSGAAAERTRHTATWTGSRMIVWGGFGDGWDGYETRINSGGIYEPVSDTWSPTSGVGAPSAKYSPASVWTGSEMIVWGGVGGDANSGGRYDPMTDTWRPTSTVGAPRGSDAFTAVWTGSQMIVWGGLSLGGGRYNAGDARDADGDGVAACVDCDDTDAAIHPGATEICNGIDDDCSGLVDDDAAGSDPDADGVLSACDDCPAVTNSDQVDLDGDGLGDACDPDIDGDEVLNPDDLCAATPQGAVVDPANGCSIAQLAPCAGARGTNQPWKSHGAYVAAVADAAEEFFDLGLIEAAEQATTVSAAGQSSCGKR
jgi:N-acetylneuraminic acid mutarotase